MYNKIILFCALTLSLVKSNAQPNWEKIDFTVSGQPSVIYNLLSAFTIKNDSQCFIKSGLGYGTTSLNQYHNLQEINLRTGAINILDTYSIKVNSIFCKNQKLYGIGYGLWQFNFSSNKWDSINDFWIGNGNKKQNFWANASQDTVLLFGRKIQKFNISTKSVKVVCDSSIFSGGIITSKNYYAFYQPLSSLGQNYDSVFLLVSL